MGRNKEVEEYLKRVERRDRISECVHSLWKCIRLPLVILAALGVIFAILYNVPYIERYSRSYEGLEIDSRDESYCEPITLTLDGEYYHYLFRNDYFEGSVSISGFQPKRIMHEDIIGGEELASFMKVKIESGEYHGMGFDTKPYLIRFVRGDDITGSYLTSDRLDTIAIRLMEKTLNGSDIVYSSGSRTIVVPATERGEAYERYTSLEQELLGG